MLFDRVAQTFFFIRHHLKQLFGGFLIHLAVFRFGFLALLFFLILSAFLALLLLIFLILALLILLIFALLILLVLTLRTAERFHRLFKVFLRLVELLLFARFLSLVQLLSGLFGLTENTVKSRLFRLRAGLRDALLKEGIAV